MPTRELPDRPHRDHLRRQARALQREVRAGLPEAAARVSEHHPGRPDADPSDLPLHEAQLVIAREHGFPSWPRLMHHLADREEHLWDPARPPQGRVEEFCRLACLTYSADDDPSRRARARQMLAAEPGLVTGSITAAAAAADLTEVSRLLQEDPARATERSGSSAWGPLFVLAYSRLDPDVAEAPVLGIAEALLEAGADPDEGYLWNGGPSVFTVLTGVFGGGELGPRRQPAHPHSTALARLLLEAGADPVDHQALYNRQFLPADDHLEVLLEHGLATGARPGPWRQRRSPGHPDHVRALRIQLRWAIEHGFAHRVGLLAAHGVDVESPFEDGRTPAEIARMYGEDDVTAVLQEVGTRHRPATVAAPSVDDLVAAIFRADRDAVDALVQEHPRLLEMLREQGANLVPWAAAREGRRDSVRLLVELGLTVDALGRSDVPVDGGWVQEAGWGRSDGELRGHSALHVAAHRGDADLVRTLLDLGADPELLDTDHHATARGWAEHAAADGEDRSAVLELLGGFSADEPAG